jgi:hypothetical protein
MGCMTAIFDLNHLSLSLLLNSRRFLSLFLSLPVTPPFSFSLATMPYLPLSLAFLFFPVTLPFCLSLETFACERVVSLLL